MAKRDYNKLNNEALYKEHIALATAEPEQLPGQIEIEEQAPKRGVGNHATYTQSEIREYQEEGKTQGRRGCKMQRLNVSMTPAIYDYVNIMAAYQGISKNQLICDILAASMKKNAALYERATAEINHKKEEFKL